MSSPPENLIDPHVSTSQPVSDAQDDSDLIRAIQAGCSQSFNLLFSRYWGLIFAIASKVLRQRCEAEDVVQDVFLTIFLRCDKYDASRGTVRTWIAQFAYFKALVKRRSLQLADADNLDDMAEFEAGVLRFGMIQGVMERATLVQQCLATLNPRQRRTVELVHFDGYTLLETARILGQSLANTRNLYYRGISALRLQLRAAQPQSEQREPQVVASLPNAAAESFSL